MFTTEIEALIKFQDELESVLYDAFRHILACRGKTVITGVGKSGLIARKISSTFSSTGTSSVYIHAGEAMHGDLGVVGKDDVVLIISRSGEVSELIYILPAIKKIGAAIIALTANAKSTLARYADCVINMGDLQEACPHNLAPTTSTTLCLVIGDALAIALMKQRKFSMEDYALFHPGGSLGRRLLCRVEDVMKRDEHNPVVNINASIKDMLGILSSKWAGAASVVDDKNHLLGLITDYDIRTHLEMEHPLFQKSLSDLMNPDPSYTYSDEKAYDILKRMQERKKPINLMPVLDRTTKEVVGMVTLQDLVRAGLA
ncbi:MAG: SIS domain-containing protein [bacterium]